MIPYLGTAKETVHIKKCIIRDKIILRYQELQLTLNGRRGLMMCLHLLLGNRILYCSLEALKLNRIYLLRVILFCFTISLKCHYNLFMWCSAAMTTEAEWGKLEAVL